LLELFVVQADLGRLANTLLVLLLERSSELVNLLLVHLFLQLAFPDVLLECLDVFLVDFLLFTRAVDLRLQLGELKVFRRHFGASVGDDPGKVGRLLVRIKVLLFRLIQVLFQHLHDTVLLLELVFVVCLQSLKTVFLLQLSLLHISEACLKSLKVSVEGAVVGDLATVGADNGVMNGADSVNSGTFGSSVQSVTLFRSLMRAASIGRVLLASRSSLDISFFLTGRSTVLV